MKCVLWWDTTDMICIGTFEASLFCFYFSNAYFMGRKEEEKVRPTANSVCIYHSFKEEILTNKSPFFSVKTL